MSEEDAALFWEVDLNLASSPQSGNWGSEPSHETTLTADIIPEEVIPSGPVPTSELDGSRSVDVGAILVDGSQDTKSVESVHTVRGLDQAGVPADNTFAHGPLCPHATIGTQTDEMGPLGTEISLKDETPTSLTETITPGPTPPKSIRMKCKGRRKADLGTPDGPTPEFEDNVWATLPFAEATWRPTYRVRAVTSGDDVDPRVQEVLDLPVLDLAVAQDEDPDLVFMKELLRDHDTRPQWDTI